MNLTIQAASNEMVNPILAYSIRLIVIVTNLISKQSGVFMRKEMKHGEDPNPADLSGINGAKLLCHSIPSLLTNTPAMNRPMAMINIPWPPF